MTGAKRAAKRPPARTVHVVLPYEPKGKRPIGEAFDGWEATARADFPAGWLADLQSGDPARAVEAGSKIILEHNMPNADDQVAATIGDVEPFDGVFVMLEAIAYAIGSLPPR